MASTDRQRRGAAVQDLVTPGRDRDLRDPLTADGLLDRDLAAQYANRPLTHKDQQSGADRRDGFHNKVGGVTPRRKRLRRRDMSLTRLGYQVGWKACLRSYIATLRPSSTPATLEKR